MFSWLKKEEKTQEVVETALNEMKKIYRTKLLPLEEFYHFHDFHSPKLEDPDFDAKPMILLVGQYSTGKTTFIRYLLERWDITEKARVSSAIEPTSSRWSLWDPAKKSGWPHVANNCAIIRFLSQRFSWHSYRPWANNRSLHRCNVRW